MLFYTIYYFLYPNQDSLNSFFTNINPVHKNIVFTKELEINNCLHFLDVFIQKSSAGFISSTQARNQLGTPGGAKCFLKGAQIF